MSRIRRGGHLFITWAGDHSPRHVHVFRDRRLVLKSDLERRRPMKGRAATRIVKVIDELVSEGLL
ncbi:MAG: hypothetical protein ACYS0D_07505 [Planctomycetota bacterium]|jgi:hypothetical protein